MLIYDCEIKKAIQGRKEPRAEGIEYCKGWDDHAGMGISCITAYDYRERRFRVFLEDNFDEFQTLVKERLVIGFNSINFDDKLCAANGLEVTTEYDVLVELWAAAGLGPKFNYRTHGGFGLDACGSVNFHRNKTGSGANAPVWWQRKLFGRTIDYCLEDSNLTKMLVDKIIEADGLADPRNGNNWLRMRRP